MVRRISARQRRSGRPRGKGGHDGPSSARKLNSATPPGPDAKPAPRPGPSTESFPVVGVGASAGGLEAFGQLLRNVPADTGMAFVIIQHLDPTHESLLAEILSRDTRMPVHEAASGMRVEPDHVYVIPPIASWSSPTAPSGWRRGARPTGATCPWTTSSGRWPAH